MDTIFGYSEKNTTSSVFSLFKNSNASVLSMPSLNVYGALKLACALEASN
jgi:hypothetical protein